MIAITTLCKIRAKSPCEQGWVKLLSALGKTKADDEQLTLGYILESNGIDDALWCLRAVDGCDRSARLFAADCAEAVLHLFEKERPGDNRPRLCIQAARDFANGKIDEAARAAAIAAAMAAARAAVSDAAMAAAMAAAWAASWAAASDAARAAASDAARAAAMAAVSDAAMDSQKIFFIKHFCSSEDK